MLAPRKVEAAACRGIKLNPATLGLPGFCSWKKTAPLQQALSGSGLLRDSEGTADVGAGLVSSSSKAESAPFLEALLVCVPCQSAFRRLIVWRQLSSGHKFTD